MPWKLFGGGGKREKGATSAEATSLDFPAAVAAVEKARETYKVATAGEAKFAAHREWELAAQAAIESADHIRNGKERKQAKAKAEGLLEAVRQRDVSEGESPASAESGGGAGGAERTLRQTESDSSFNAGQWVSDYFFRANTTTSKVAVRDAGGKVVGETNLTVDFLFKNFIHALNKKKFVAPAEGVTEPSVEKASKKEQRLSIEAFITVLRNDAEYQKLGAFERQQVEFSVTQKALFNAEVLRLQEKQDKDKTWKEKHEKLNASLEKIGTGFAAFRDAVATYSGLKSWAEFAKKHPVWAQTIMRSLLSGAVITAAVLTGGWSAALTAGSAVVGGQLGAFGLDKAGGLIDGSAESWKKDYEKSASKALNKGDWLKAITLVQKADITEIQKIMSQRSLVRKIFGGVLGGGAGYAAGGWMQANMDVIATAIKSGGGASGAGLTPDYYNAYGIKILDGSSGQFQTGPIIQGNPLESVPSSSDIPALKEVHQVPPPSFGPESGGNVNGAESTVATPTPSAESAATSTSSGEGGAGGSSAVTAGTESAPAGTTPAIPSAAEAAPASQPPTAAPAEAAPVAATSVNSETAEHLFSGWEGQTDGKLTVEIVDWNAEQAGMHQANSFDQAVGHIQEQLAKNLQTAGADASGLEHFRNFLEHFTRDDVGRAVGALLKEHSMIVHSGDHLSMHFDTGTQTFKLDFIPGSAHPAGTLEMHFDLSVVPKEGGGFELVSSERIIPNPDAFITHPNFDAAGNVIPTPEGATPASIPELPPALENAPYDATLPTELYNPIMDALNTEGVTSMTIGDHTFAGGGGGGTWEAFSNALNNAVQRGGGHVSTISFGGGGNISDLHVVSLGEAGSGHAVSFTNAAELQAGLKEAGASAGTAAMYDVPGHEYVWTGSEVLNFESPQSAVLTYGSNQHAIYIGGPEGTPTNQIDYSDVVTHFARENPNAVFAAKATDGAIHTYQWGGTPPGLQDLGKLDMRTVSAITQNTGNNAIATGESIRTYLDTLVTAAPAPVEAGSPSPEPTSPPASTATP